MSFCARWMWPLQRSRALSSAEIVPQLRLAPRLVRFNGAALFRARRSATDARTKGWSSLLQRSRALSSAEIRTVCSKSPVLCSLQRSRALSSAEIPDCCACRSSQSGFNGAALFRARRCLRSGGAHEHSLASTEPRSFERGDSRARRRSGARCSGLQRSRALSSAEMVIFPEASIVAAPASTEPRSFERGDLEYVRIEAVRVPLQRSRALSSAEIVPVEHAREIEIRMLQRSRALSSAEIRSTRTRRPCPRHCFNGAALFRARRCEFGGENGGGDRGFNGAALFRARRYSRRVVSPRRSGLLQRSRALSSAEIKAAKSCATYRVTLQRSRALSSAEIKGRGVRWHSWRRASTEPRSFERGDQSGEIVRDIPCHASTEPRSFERGDKRTRCSVA